MNNTISILRIPENEFSFEVRTDNMSGHVEVLDSRKLPQSPDLRAFFVKFENGAFTKWHSHSGTQILQVAEGIGFVEQEGQEPQDILPGDQVYIPGNIWHRHGAKEGQMMMHLAITSGGTKWEKEDNFSPQQLDFIISEHQSKIEYLKDHFTRMLTRFNYFIILQAALLGGELFQPDENRWLLPVFGMILSGFWYVLGAEDRFLVALYRKQIEKSWEKVKVQLHLTDIFYTGQTSDTEKLYVDTNLLQWRIEKISTTHLTGLFPLITFILWAIVLTMQIIPSY